MLPKFGKRLKLLYKPGMAGPKCGPPTYFCGPWNFFITRNLVKNFNKNIQRTIKVEIVTLSSLIWNSVARDEK